LAPQLEAVKKLLTEFGAKQIIHGHIHIEETKEFIFNDKKTLRISLGAWNNKGRILIYRKDHSFEFKNL
jgi:UDP-2,3-diacylglucosamine pyrophosphatase LpxH